MTLPLHLKRALQMQFRENETFMPTMMPSHRLRHIACLAAIVCALGVGEKCLRVDQAESRVVEQTASSHTLVFGPGGRIAVNAVEPLNGANEEVPDAIAAASFATEDRELVVNTGLLQVYDYFLQHAPDAGRPNSLIALRMFLQDRLRAASTEKALQIAADYRSYRNQHDGLLAAQNFDHRGVNLSTADQGRIRTWMQLRQRLRQSALGDAVAVAWYENDDAQLSHVLDELQQAATFDDATRRQMQKVLDKATTPFAGLADRAFRPE